MAHAIFTRQGIRVSSPPSLAPINPGADYVRFPEDDPTLSDIEIQRRTEQRILAATAIYVVCPGGYTGSLASFEIGRATEAKRPLYFSEFPTEPFIRMEAEGRIVAAHELADMIIQNTITPIIPIGG
jgi:hypothetical protein